MVPGTKGDVRQGEGHTPLLSHARKSGDGHSTVKERAANRNRRGQANLTRCLIVPPHPCIAGQHALRTQTTPPVDHTRPRPSIGRQGTALKTQKRGGGGMPGRTQSADSTDAAFPQAHAPNRGPGPAHAGGGGLVRPTAFFG